MYIYIKFRYFEVCDRDSDRVLLSTIVFSISVPLPLSIANDEQETTQERLQFPCGYDDDISLARDRFLYRRALRSNLE